MTFSIAGLCADTGQLGIAISSSSPAVAARCAHLRAGVGAVCSQNVTDPRLGPAALDRLAAGESAPDAVAALLQRPHVAHRQLTAVDAAGRTAHFSGAHTLGTHRAAAGACCVAAGNMLASPSIPDAMVVAFERAAGELGARLLAALAAGLAAGGEAGPIRSAGLLVAGDTPFLLTDLRVDWDDAPVERLAALWALWAPQAGTYRLRALDPTAAPSYGVPGDP